MKLYIWNTPYSVNYGSSLCFSIANDLRQAKKIAKSSKAYKYGIYDNGSPFVELGKPDRILKLPCGEWHEWSE